MPLPGISAENELKPLLKKLLNDKDEVYKFAVAASGPRDGQLILDKKVKLKKKEVQQEAEAEAKKNGGKAVKMDVMTGECRLDATNATTLRLIVNGKAPAKAVACVEHLLARGPFKAIGFTGVILEEVEEESADATAPPTTDDGAAPAASTSEPKTESDLMARLNALGPRIKEFAAAADAAGKEAGADLEAKKAALAPRNRLLTLFRDCKGLIGTNDEQAEAMLADIVGILNAGQGEGRTPTTSPNAKSDLLARLNALGPRIKEFAAAADAAGKEAGADLEAKKAALAPRNRLLTLFRDCKGLIGTNDEQAEAMLADIEGILTTGPGEGRTPTSGPAVQTAASTGNDDPSPAKTPELQARLKSLLLRQKAIFEKDPDQRKALMPFSQPATSLAPTGQPGATEALDKLESAIAAIETQLAAKGGTAEPTEKKDEQEPPAEPPKPATFEDRIAEVEAAIGRLKPENPFVADLRSRLQFLQGNRPQEDDTRGWEITNQNLSVLQERATEALPFERKLELVQSLMEKVQGDPRLGNLATELLERVNGVLTFARQQMPELGSRIAQSMAELATLEQKARSGLPADVVKNLDELLDLQARADEVWDKIETVGDDDVRGKLLDQYRQLTEKIPSSDAVTSDSLAEARELLATLEQQLKDALAAAPASTAGQTDEEKTADPTDAGQEGVPLDLEQQMNKLEPKLLEAQKADPDARTLLAGLWSFAKDQVAAGDAEKAKTAIERLKKAIDAASANKGKSDTERFGIREGLVAERRAELEKFFVERLAAAQAVTAAQVTSVEKAVSAQAADDDPQGLARGIQDALDEMFEEVKADLQEPLESATATAEEILKRVEEKRAEVAADPLVQVLQKTKSALGVDANVAAGFTALFDEVENKVHDLAAN